MADGAKAYDVTSSRCVNPQGAVVGGTATRIAGGACTSVGATFIVAGGMAGDGAHGFREGPNAEVGLGSVGLRWAF